MFMALSTPSFGAQKKYKISEYQTPGIAEEGASASSLNFEKAAEYIQTTTAIAISPLLVVGAKGLTKWYQTPADQRSALSFINRPWVWGVFLGIGIFFIINSFIGTLIPPLKKPMDLIEPFEHMISGFLVGLPIVLSMVFSSTPSVAALFAGSDSAVAGFILPSIASISWVSVALTTVVWTIAVVICFVSVWSFSQFMNLLIVLSPWGGIDLGLRLCKGIVLAAIFLAGFISPWLSIFLCGAIIVSTLLALKISLRASRYLLYLISDFVLGQIRPHRGEVGAIKACALTRIEKIKKRTVGSLNFYDDGKVRFRHFGGNFHELPAGLELRDGFLGGIVFDPKKENNSYLFRISRRYRLRHVEVAQRLQLAYSTPDLAGRLVISNTVYGGTHKVDIRNQNAPRSLSLSRIWGYIKYGLGSYMRFWCQFYEVRSYARVNDDRFYYRSEEDRQRSLEFWSKMAESGRQACETGLKSSVE